jgi:hypothetical protein
MSNLYTEDVSNHPSKMKSRVNIAHAIRKTGKHSKVIHYLGGTDRRLLFENHFTGIRNTFVRYEKRFCSIPFNYSWARWDGNELMPKENNQIGYFVNGDFFDECINFMKVFKKQRNYFWLDFCGMPTESLLEYIYGTLFYPESEYSECVEDVFLTFYLNPRGQKFVSNILSKYGTSIEDRANSLADGIRDSFNLKTHSVSVFETYYNGISPMAVIRIARNETFEL